MGIVSHPKDIAERRQAARRMVHKRHAVTLVFEVPLDDHIVATVIDIATQGVGLCASHKIPTSSIVTLEVNGIGYSWKVQGKVVWCQKIPLSGHVIKAEVDLVWRIGVQILDDTEESRNLMQNLCETL